MRTTLPSVENRSPFPAPSRPSATGIACSVLACTVAMFVLTSIGEGLGSEPLPTFLDASMSMVPGPFRIHILACCCGVVAASAAFTAALSGRPHRSIGRLALALLLVGAAASVPVAMAGGSAPAAKAAFLGQATTLIVAVLVGWVAGVRRQLRLHRAGMACAALALSGAVLSRLALKVPVPWLGPSDDYAAVAWFSWLAPFCAVALARLVAPRGQLSAVDGEAR